MRISIERGDAGYVNPYEPDRRPLVIRLNGQSLRFPVTADTDLGYVRYYGEARLSTGEVVPLRDASGDPILLESYGRVTIDLVAEVESQYLN